MSLVILASISGFIFAITAPGVAVINYHNYPCWLRSFLVMLLLPLLCTNVLIRIMSFFFLNELHKGISAFSNQAVLMNQEDQLMLVADSKYQWWKIFSDVSFSLQVLIFSKNIQGSDSNRVISVFLFVSSRRGILLFIFLFLLPFLAVDIALILQDPVYLHGCTGCLLSSVLDMEIIVVALIFLLFCLFIAWRVRKYIDPWGIRREVLYMAFGGGIVLLGFILGVFVDLPQDSAYDHSFLIVLGYLIVFASQTVLQVFIGLSTEQRQKKCRNSKHDEINASVSPEVVDSGTDIPKIKANGHLELISVLKDPILLREFEGFLAGELGMESLTFLKAIENWKQCYFDIAPSARLARARKIFQTFISPTGSFPVNLPSKVIITTRNELMSESLEDCPRKIFDRAEEEIKYLLQIGAIQRFQKSKSSLQPQRPNELTS